MLSSGCPVAEMMNIMMKNVSFLYSFFCNIWFLKVVLF